MTFICVTIDHVIILHANKFEMNCVMKFAELLACSWGTC